LNKNERMRAGWAGVLISAVLLSACGGGGGGGEAPAPTPPVQGVAIPDNLAIAAAASTDVAAGTAFTSNAAATTGLSFAWNFGDGTSSTEASPKHDYAKVGDYAVTLKVSNAAGASKEVKWTVSVNNRAHVQGLSCTGADGAGWCWQAPRPTGTVPLAFFFIDASNGWSVGDNGEILRTRDGGVSWTKQPTGLTTRLTTIRFSDANNGWAAGDAGALLRTTDGGARWTLQPTAQPPMTGASLQLAGASTMVMSVNGQIRATADGGATWSQASLTQEPMLSADGALWWFDNGALRKSTDLGKTSTVVLPAAPSVPLSGFQVFGNEVVASGTSSNYVSGQGWVYTLSIRHSADGGQSWEAVVPQGLPSTGYFSQGNPQFADASTGAIVANGTLYRSVDGGRNWTAVAAPANVYPGFSVSYGVIARGVWMRQYYPSSGTGTVTDISTDLGLTWRAARLDYGSQFTSIDAQTWLVTGWDNVTRISTDLQTWKRIAGPDADAGGKTLQAFWFFDAKRGLALSAKGDLMETANGGLDWTVKVGGLTTSGYYSMLPRFQFVDAKKGWLLAADGRIYLTDDGGLSWLTPLQSSGRSITAFHFIDAANGFALASEYQQSQPRQLLLATTDGGKSWTQQATLDGRYNDLKFSNPLKGTLVGNGGAVVVTTDGGKTFTGRFSGTSAAINQLAFSDADTLWAVGDAGLLMSSKDGGASWTIQASVSLPMTGLRAIRFLTAQQGWAVGDSGTVLMTTDGGATWKKQFVGTQSSLTQVFFVDARTGWVAGSAGTLLATGTGGQ